MLHVAKIAFSVGEVATAHRIDRRMAAHLAATRAQDLGPSFVKLGQFASTRGDVLSQEYFEEFASLRNDVRRDDPVTAKGLVCKALGIEKVADMFSEFEDNPIASASVAQVHKARLVGTGQVVAVKLLKSGVKEAIEKDIAAAKAVANVISRISPSNRTQINELFFRYSTLLRRETDFEAEAIAAKRARRTLLSSLGDEVIVPRPILWQPGIIVMEFVPSTPISSANSLSRITSLVMESILCLISSGECFHQDPHDGNLGVVKENGVERLVLYDFGNVASLSHQVLDGLLEAGMAFQLKDAGMLADALIKHGLVKSDAMVREFRPALVAMIRQGFQYVRTMNIRSFDPSEIDKESAHLMSLGEDINGVMRSVTMAEGVCKSAYPGFDLQRSIDQFLAVHSIDILAMRAKRDMEHLMK